jgi:hypothetical protein
MRKGDILRHFKGGWYKVLVVAKDETTKEDVVVYQDIVSLDGQTWVRPAKDFATHIEREDYSGPRFTQLRVADGFEVVSVRPYGERVSVSYLANNGKSLVAATLGIDDLLRDGVG